MKINFWKMHGAGNDFILFDDRNGSFPLADTDWISTISARHTGIGCEGLILIQESDLADFRMRFFNPDGNEVEMCGNGARCAAKLAVDLDAAPSRMTIETVAGVIKATAEIDTVRIEMPSPSDWQLNRNMLLNDEEIPFSFVNTGVPHVVIDVTNLDSINILKTGAGIRHHELFSPAGTNVNFISVADQHSISVRTYERGVEAETMSCGTGITAAALVAAKNGRTSPPTTVKTKSGDTLIVDFALTAAGADNVTLTGPAAIVFTGSLEY